MNSRNSAHPNSGNKDVKHLSDIPRFPFRSFAELQTAASEKKINVGVDPFAAARWSDQHSTSAVRALTTSLSMLLLLAAVSAAVLAIVTHAYWLFAALPAMGITFYFSNPSSEYRKWVTIGGAASVAVFLDLVVNGMITAALIVAYAGLTFAAVRAAGFVANSSFRKALLSEEELFIRAYLDGQCSVKEKDSERVYSRTAPRL